MIKAVIFDMDGTLVDAQLWHYEALNEALEVFGYSIPLEEHKNRFDGLPTMTKLSVLSREQGLPAHLFPTISLIKQERTRRHIASKCFPRVEQLLMFQALRDRGFKLAVATNSILETAQIMLVSAGLREYLDIVLTNEDVKNPKPHPEIYTVASEQLGLRPDECLVVEDNPFGIESATIAGCRVVKVERVEDVRFSLIEDELEG